MNKQNKAAAFTALDKFASSRVSLIEELKKAGYKTAEAAREIVIEYVSEKTGVPFKIAESSGKMMLDSKHAKYEGAKTAVRDFMLMIEGTTRHASSARKEVDAVDAALKAFEKLSAAERRAFLKKIGAA